MQRSSLVSNEIQQIELNQISPSNYLSLRIDPENTEDFEGLVNSIRKHGLLHPLIVRPTSAPTNSETSFELVTGYRRFIACKRILLTNAPCLVRELDDREALEISLIENIQRQTLNPIEEAEAFKRYVVSFGRGSITGLARKIGKSEEYVSHRLLLLGLPKPILEKISRRLLKPSHAMELVWMKNREETERLAERICNNNLSIHQTRRLARIFKTSLKESGSEELESARGREFPDLIRKQTDGQKDDSSRKSALQTYERILERERNEVKLLNEAILVVRSALAGLDHLVSEAEGSGLQSLFMQERQRLHESVDSLIKEKVAYSKRFPYQSR